MQNISNIIHFILAHNNFEFNKRHFEKDLDISMGTTMTPSCVNICDTKLLHRRGSYLGHTVPNMVLCLGEFEVALPYHNSKVHSDPEW